MSFPSDVRRTPSHRLLLAAVLGALVASAGCQWCQSKWDRLKGDGFPEWSDSMGAARGNASDAQPSGYFTDRRSEQIEKSLGGGF
jgi:hypothetical protein